MRVESLGYVRARAKDLGDWASFGPGLLGLQRVDKSRSTIAFRMDDRKQRIIVNADGGEGIDRVRLGGRPTPLRSRRWRRGSMPAA